VTDQWVEQGACRDLSAEQMAMFYVDRGQSITPAARICASCPVVRECIIDDIRHTKVHFASAGGARGGVGGLGRRRLIWLRRDHDDIDHPPESECKDPDCRWCVALRAHQANLDVLAGRRPSTDRTVIDGNGPKATHGMRSTYARGCHQGQCAAAIATRAHGTVDLEQMWADLLPGLPNGSLCDPDAPQWERDVLKRWALEQAEQQAVAA
jgi:hypothetical protein